MGVLYKHTFYARDGSWNLLLIQTCANGERVAEAALAVPHRSCAAYFPKILARRSHARRVGYVERPFLPRYGFVDGDWRTVRSAPGVACVVASGREVQAAVDEIRAREYGVVNDGGELVYYVRLDEEPSPFAAGDAIVVTTLAARGIFCRMLGAVRAEVLLGMMRAVVPIGCLEVA